MTNDDSRELLERTKAGDAAAIDRLLQQHVHGLRAYVRLRMDPDLRARESCSDLVQSVCLDLLRNLDSFEYRGERSFKAWLYNSALRKIRQRERYHRADKRAVRHEIRPSPRDAETRATRVLDFYASFYTPSRQAIAREELGRVEAAFDRLPEEYREVISLSRIVGLSHAEIAELMERRETAVRSLLHRAIARLSTLLDTP